MRPVCFSVLVFGWVTYDLEGVSDNSHCHELLAVVSPVHHQRVGQTLDDRALSLAEPLDRISAGRMGDVYRRTDLDVVAIVLQQESAGQPMLPFSRSSNTPTTSNGQAIMVSQSSLFCLVPFARLFEGLCVEWGRGRVLR